ncbi:MAG TPA: twin-arginine translocation signal domain-containing protein, partial [Gemmatimonadaceae bacterium]|nr:twin-arginine translocation signal domain-containing protein [Gemmatimonadaceae bacterium]
MTSRREFLKKTGAAAALAAAGSVLGPDLAGAFGAPRYPRGVESFEELPVKELLAAALEAAKAAGATWADARIGRY